MFDLVIRGGKAVVPGVGVLRADIGITGGVVAALADRIDGPGRATFEADGLYVMPGVVDPHVHLGNSEPFEAEAVSETRAALLGGVTSIGVFLRRRDSYLPHLPGYRQAIEQGSYVDVAFHLQIFTDEQRCEIPEYARAPWGVRSFKMYLAGIPGIVEPVDTGFLLAAFRTIAGLGADAVACVHAEDDGLVRRASEDLRRALPEGGTLADWERAHPAEAEVLAINSAAYLASLASAHLYVVHVSSRQGVEAVREWRRRGVRLTAETTSPYLGLSSDCPNGFLAKLVPPVRSAEHRSALWQGLEDGSLQTIGTDNTSRTRATKQPEAGLHGARPGYAGLGTHLPVLLHHGFHQRGIGLEVLADWASRAPARTFGVYPKKGTIAIGSDADLVIVDLDRGREVRAEQLGGLSDFSPFEGQRLRGWPVATIKSGVVAARQGEVLVPAGTGRYLPRR
jgi:dihydroorotase-like cyclic amidohydrolase